MRKIFTILSFAALSAVNAQYDGFNYTTPLEENGWVKHSGSVVLSPITSSSDNGNSLSFAGIPASEGNRMELTPTGNVAIHKTFPNSSNTVVYTSFLMKVTDTSALAENTVNTPPTGYFFHFSSETGTIGSTGLVCRIGMRKGSLPNTYNISLVNTSGGSPSVSQMYGANPVNYTVGQTYFVVVKYDMTGDVGKSSIWINTLSEAEVMNSSDFGNSAKQDQISSLILRQRNNGPRVELDEVRYGTTWKEVTEGTLSTGEVNNKAKNILSNTLVVDQFKVLSNQKTSVEVYSLTGQLVKTVQVAPQNAVNVSNLPSGVYIVKVVEGSQTYTQKIVKK